MRAQRDKAAARRFFEKAFNQNCEPDSVTIDGNPANLAALHDINAARETPIIIRQVKYLNNIVEQDIGRSSASPDRCLASKPFAARAFSLAESS